MPAPMTSNSTSNTNLSVNLAPYAGRWIALVRGHVASVGRTASEAAALAKTARPKEEPTVVFVPMSSSDDTVARELNDGETR